MASSSWWAEYQGYEGGKGSYDGGKGEKGQESTKGKGGKRQRGEEEREYHRGETSEWWNMPSASKGGKGSNMHPNWVKNRYPAHFSKVYGSNAKEEEKKEEENQSASYCTMYPDKPGQGVTDGMWNAMSEEFLEYVKEDEDSTIIDVRPWTTKEHYSDIISSVRYLMAQEASYYKYINCSVAKIDLFDYMKEQIQNEAFKLEDLEEIVSNSGIFHMKNNVNKNCRISFREEFAKKEDVVKVIQSMLRRGIGASYKMKADWNVIDEQILAVEDEEETKNEEKTPPTLEEMTSGNLKYRTEDEAIDMYNKATNILKEKDEMPMAFQLKVAILEHGRQDAQGNKRGVARQNQWEVFAERAEQMTNDEFDEHRDKVSEFLTRQMKPSKQQYVFSMYQRTRQEEAEGSNLFIGRVITSEKGAFAVRVYLEKRYSTEESTVDKKIRLEQNFTELTRWISDVQGIPVSNQLSRYLVENSETCRYIKEIPLWARMIVQVKTYIDPRNWNQIAYCVTDVGMLGKPTKELEIPKPADCTENQVYFAEYVDHAKIEWASEWNENMYNTPFPVKFEKQLGKREIKHKIPREVFAYITTEEMPFFHQSIEKVQ